MTDRPIDAVIDHAASLQQQVDRLSREVQILALALLFMAGALMLAGPRIWRD